MEYSFQHPKSYRAEILNAESAGTTVLYVLHGYGQLARYFIQKFTSLPKNLLIVAPEGMHRFYTNGHSGRVGASWMTKENREVDIADNISWLDALDQQLSTEYRIERRIVLGFSQGGSTALRWNLKGSTLFDALLVWAGDFPPEERENYCVSAQLQQHFFIGAEDEFIRPGQQQELIALYESKGFVSHSYRGKHDIEPLLLASTIESLLQ